MIAELGLAVTVLQLFQSRQRTCLSGPYEQKPEGTSDNALGMADMFGMSRAKYRITSFARGAEQVFHVARRASNSDWISFLVSSTTGEKIFWRADASSPRGMEIMRKDFQV
jgi:hypothetical protein